MRRRPTSSPVLETRAAGDRAPFRRPTGSAGRSNRTRASHGIGKWRRRARSLRRSLRNATPIDLSAVDGSFLNETERVLPRVLGVERALAPRTDDDPAAGRIVNILAGEAAAGFGALHSAVEIPTLELERLVAGTILSPL